MNAPRFNEQGANQLADLHSRVMNLLIDFRSRVCEECAWSMPTYYRKMRMEDGPMKDGEYITSVLSNAEKKMIIAVFDSAFNDLWEYAKKYRKNP